VVLEARFRQGNVKAVLLAPVLDGALVYPYGLEFPKNWLAIKAHHRGVQAVELVFELELVLRGQGLTTPLHHADQGLEKTSGPPVVSLGKGATGHRLRSQVVEVLESGFKAGHALPPAGPSR
jgi:hypothetical protein